MKDFSPPDHTLARVQRSFRRGLSSYHQHAVVQAEIADILATEIEAEIEAEIRAEITTEAAAEHGTNSLGRVLEFDRVLEFGCGTGYLTRNLRKKFFIKELFVNDLVDECKAKIAPYEIRFIGGAVDQIYLPQHLDLICAASTVQWIDDLPALMHKLTQSLRPGGILALSGFATRHFKELQHLGSQAAAPSYVDAADWPAILPAQLQVKTLREQDITLWFDTAQDLLRHLRKTGVNGQSSTPWSKSDLFDFSSRYGAVFAQNGKLPLTYAPVWLVAQKKRLTQA